MSYLLNGLTDYLSRSDACGMTDYPLTIACWVKPSSFSNQTPIGLFHKSSKSHQQIYMVEYDKTVGALTNYNGGSAVIYTTTQYELNSWQHVCAIFTSATSRKPYLDGGGSQEGTFSLPWYSSINSMAIGASLNYATYRFFKGLIAEAAIWNIALSDENLALLAAGAVPSTISLGNLVAYWPLFEDAKDAKNSYDLTISGTPVLDGDNPLLVAPIITDQTASPVDIYVGQPLSLSVTVGTGTEPFTYVWTKDGSLIVGATSATYIVPSATAANSGSYVCTVSNVVDSDVSTAIVVTVWPAFSIPAQTTSPVAANTGHSLELSVTAAGGGGTLTYQWDKGGVDISGETSSTYTVEPVLQSTAGTYNCIVSDDYTSLSTTDIIVSVSSLALWYLDEGHFLDEDSTAESKMTFDVGFATISDVDVFNNVESKMTFTVTMDVIAPLLLDFLDLIPEHFTASVILQEYLEEAAIQVGDWMSKVRDIILLLSPNTTTSMTYLRELGSIIGVTFPPEDETSETEMRKVLEDAVSWYKAKGTYYSLILIALIYQQTINIYDMYTNDYSTFYLTDWFVGDEDENPPGFDSSYYKSPHFGVEVVLNKITTEGSANFLWYDDSFLSNFIDEVERTRPVHTVPHYLMLLNPRTDEFGNIIVSSGNIQCKTTGNWNPSTKFFDETPEWHFDDNVYFDQSATALIKSITTWVMGTGNYPSDLDDSGFVIEGASITGNIDVDDIIITDEKITFEFLVPKGTIASNLSCLGAYTPGLPDQLMLAATFPKINKSNLAELRVFVEVYRSDLS